MKKSFYFLRLPITRLAEEIPTRSLPASIAIHLHRFVVSDRFSRIYYKWFVLERCRRTWASHCQWPVVEIDKSR